MSNNTNIAENNNQNTEMVEQSARECIVASACEKYSLGYAMDMIERIATDTQHIYHALDAIASLPNEPTPVGGSAEEPAKAAAEVVRCRETTNQKLLEFYRQMVEDLKPRSTQIENDEKVRQQFLDFVQHTTFAAESGVELPDFEMIWQTVFLGQEKSHNKDEPLTRDDKIEKITMIQHSILDIMQKYQSEEDFELVRDRVVARLDALCTDILADKL